MSPGAIETARKSTAGTDRLDVAIGVGFFGAWLLESFSTSSSSTLIMTAYLAICPMSGIHTMPQADHLRRLHA
jgi:hypothetical protein